MSREREITILLADDDEEDRMMTADALRECGLRGQVRFVADGQEVLDYLRRRGRFAEPSDSPRPDLVFLDLNMPRLHGHEVLDRVKKDPELRRIPIVVLTTTSAAEEVIASYDLGANSFITKPVTFGGLVRTMRSVSHYWGEVVELP